MDRFSKHLKSSSLICFHVRKILVNRPRFSFGRRHKDSKGSFPGVSSLQFADVDLLHLHHRILKNGGIKFHCLLGLVIEPQKWRNFWHLVLSLSHSKTNERNRS